MPDDNIVKFQRPKSAKKQQTSLQLNRKLIWVAIVVAVMLVWAYFQYVAVHPVP